MNPINPRFLSSAYRKEPISSFLIAVGLVDAVIGGFNDRLGLFSFGMITVGSAIALRWWLQQQRPVKPIQSSAQRYLPPASSNSVPIATSKRKHSS